MAPCFLAIGGILRTNSLKNGEKRLKKMRRMPNGLPGAAVKWIAFILMVLDHTGAALIAPYMSRQTGVEALGILYTASRCMGRGAFPLYLMLLVEGVKHTHSGKRYAARLFVSGLISEIPFDMALYGQIYPQHQNVMFTLAVGAAALRMTVTILQKQDHLWLRRLIGYGIIPAAGCLICQFYHTDYGLYGILALYGLWFVSKKADMLAWGFLASSIILTCMAPIEALTIVFTPVAMEYDGQKGRQDHVWYAAYPGHLTILAVLRWGLFGA